MTMRSGAPALAALAATAFFAAAQAEPTLLWETKGFSTPESVLAVPAEGFAYVSNVAGNPLDKDGNGFISKVSLADGKIIARKWAEGLNGPKGMALSNGKLFVSDVDKLVEIDPATGKITASHEVADPGFLNDVAADANGNVYMTDSNTSSIWRLADGKLEKWVDGAELKYPNGVFVEGDSIIVAPWGPPGTTGKPAEPAGLLKLSIADKKIEALGDGTPVGNLDGIEADGDDYLVSDWVAGKVFRIAKSGKAELLLDLGQGAADIGYDPASKTLLVPMMKDDLVRAYKVQ
ncbi:SMP-30/gluconolactonase/LRE family protein [Hyphomicrobium sulfonivorans]|uniref:SMP-30/gluconolactonase/LRE family protein n=2 Tax=Hyphomicrobium sulfonivorans TaxID=121290 RepID=UPI0018E0EF0E|nr:hypothetical protein [Hyphomicrobium sulfonivorans]MBI1648522.1 hypothetical protein [Hyphomicrobium sulfonivorans]